MMAQIVTRVGSGDGSVSYEPTGFSAFYGEEYLFTATPSNGYVFERWECKDSDSYTWWNSITNPVRLYFDAARQNTEAVAYFKLATVTNRLIHGSSGELLYGAYGSLLYDGE